MFKDDLLAKLHAAGLQISSEVRVQGNDRWRFLLGNGAILDCLDNGSWTVRGHDQEAVRSALGPQGEVAAPTAADSPILAGAMHVTVDTAANRVRLELDGLVESDAPPVATSFLISEELARQLSAQLSAAAYRLRQFQRPSKAH
ncbi:MAG: hypothetical protein ACHQAQ_06405 [Hyphomicrobiales bacterium]